MKVVGTKLIEEFKAHHADAGVWLDPWLAEADVAIWTRPQDIKDRYASVSFLPDNRVVFNVRGNRYRMLVQVAYKTGILLVLKLGTHAEYDTW